VGTGAAVGGDYTKEGAREGNAALTFDGGRTWLAVEGADRPGGYRSCVARVPLTHGPVLIAVGPSGSDFSQDGGRKWKTLGAEGFHAVSVAPNGDAAWAVGEGGRIARFNFPSRLGLSP
jgi:hypothetical protein